MLNGRKEDRHGTKSRRDGNAGIEENVDLTEKFGIMSVPTVVFLKGGVEINRQVGVANKAFYADAINSML